MMQLSASKLGILKDCPRCFWDANNSKFARPRGIFPSLPGGIDLVMKDYFDQYRGSLPPGLKGKIEGVLMDDIATINKWRNWRSGLTWSDPKLDVKIIGALDDCLTDKEFHIPFDNKTKGSKPKDDGSQYYQLQLDIYGLLLESNGYPINGKAYLAYFYPVEILGPISDKASEGMNLPFGIDVYCLESSPDRAIEEITRAVEILEGKRPAPAGDCEYCRFGLMYPREEKNDF